MVWGGVLPVWQAVVVVLAGMWAGLINTVVGSGTLITFPVLLAIGYPPVTANVSNSLGLVPGSLSGAIGYRRELAGQGRRVRRLGLASAIGAVGGAILLLNLPASAFETIVPVLIGIALVLVIAQPWLAKRMAGRSADADGRDGIWLWLGVLVVGVYGGYFGAAQGVIVLGLMGALVAESLQRINAVKNVLTMIANLVSGIVFVFIAHVDWLVVLLIAAGSAVGGVFGARIGRRLPAVVLRGVIVVVGMAVMVKLLLPVRFG